MKKLRLATALLAALGLILAASPSLARLREGTGPQEARAFGEAFLRQTVPEADCPVEGLSLMRSQLKPSGAEYTRLALVPLGG